MARTSTGHPVNTQRRLPCRAGDVPFPDRQGRHHRIHHRCRHRAVFKCKEFTLACGPSGYATRTIGTGQAVHRPDRVLRHPGRDCAGERAAVGRHSDRRQHLAALRGQIKATEGYEVFETKSGSYTDLVIRLDAEPGKNPDFVQGMKYLFDREQMRTAIFQGYAVVGNDHPIDPTNRFYCPDVPQTAFDLDKAKFHFQKSGLVIRRCRLWPRRLRQSTSVDMAVLMQDAAQKIGLKLDIGVWPADGYWSNYWMKVPLGFWQHQPAAQRRRSVDAVLQVGRTPWNESAWKNPPSSTSCCWRRDAETDLAGRKADMCCDMQHLIHDESEHLHSTVRFNAGRAQQQDQGTSLADTHGRSDGLRFCLENVWLDG